MNPKRFVFLCVVFFFMMGLSRAVVHAEGDGRGDIGCQHNARTENVLIRNVGRQSGVFAYIERGCVGSPYATGKLDHSGVCQKVRASYYNKKRAHALRIKGDLAEHMMDSFYKKDGWEILDGKRGNQGFDGLYVKRNSLGKPISWFVADAKSGRAKLSMTKNGRQLSDSWIKANLDRLITRTELGFSQNPTKSLSDKLADLKCLQRLQSRSPRVFRMEFLVKNGDLYVSMVQESPEGKPLRTKKDGFVNKIPDVNMRTGKPNRLYAEIKKGLSSCIRSFEPRRSEEITERIMKKMALGRITDDGTFCRELSKSLGGGGDLSKKLGFRGGIRHYGGGGFNIVKSEKLLWRPDLQYDRTVLKGRFVDNYQMRMRVSVRNGLRSNELERPFGRDFVRSRGMNRMISRGAVAGGIGLFSALDVAPSIIEYNRGNISRTEMLVEIGNAAVCVCFMKIGAGIGSSFGPVGTVFGGGIGGALGGIYSATIGIYMERMRKDWMDMQADHLAEWETKDNQRRRAEYLETLRKEADENIREGHRKVLGY